MEENKYTIQGLDEYIRQGEPQQRERGEAWRVAIGLQQGITETMVFLERFFRSMLLGEQHTFRNRELHVDWKGEDDTDTVQSKEPLAQSANLALNSLQSAKIAL